MKKDNNILKTKLEKLDKVWKEIENLSEHAIKLNRATNRSIKHSRTLLKKTIKESKK